MSLVNIISIGVLNNPAPVSEPFQFEITFECNGELQDDLEWKMIYVGSAESKDYDQVLDSISVGPIPVGVNKFVFSAPAPNLAVIRPEDLLEVTVVLLCCSYQDKEFVRIGYYVNNEYLDEALRTEPPAKVEVDKLYRNILADKPKVTRYTIDWSNPKSTIVPDQQMQQHADEDMMVQ